MSGLPRTDAVVGKPRPHILALCCALERELRESTDYAAAQTRALETIRDYCDTLPHSVATVSIRNTADQALRSRHEIGTGTNQRQGADSPASASISPSTECLSPAQASSPCLPSDVSLPGAQSAPATPSCDSVRAAAERMVLTFRDWMAGCDNGTRWKEVEAAHINLRDALTNPVLAVGTAFEGLAHYVPPSYSRILWRGAYLDLPSMQVPSQVHPQPPLVDAMGLVGANTLTFKATGACEKCGKPVYPPTNRYMKAALCMGTRIWHGECFPPEGVSESFPAQCHPQEPKA